MREELQQWLPLERQQVREELQQRLLWFGQQVY